MIENLEIEPPLGNSDHVWLFVLSFLSHTSNINRAEYDVQ